MKLELELSDELFRRFVACAEWRGVSPAALGVAYIEDWLSIDYAEANGRLSRRGLYRDGPIAFDPLAAKAAAGVERSLRDRDGNSMSPGEQP